MEQHPTSHPARPALDAAQQRALGLLRRARRALLVGHQRPDGDCLGSQAALARALELSGRQAVIVNPDAAEARYAYLEPAGGFGVWNGSALPGHDLLVTLDFGDLSRCGAMEAALRASTAAKLLIDHHPQEGAAWWDEAFLDERAASTGALVARIARALGVGPDPALARAVFTAIVTDTGWFKYGNTDAESLAVAGELAACGVVPAQIYAAVYQSQGPDHPRLVARLLARLEYLAGGRLALVDLPLAQAQGLESADTDTVLDVLRAVSQVEVVLCLRELAGGEIKLSARSKGRCDVNRVCRQLGGGGHRAAAGATMAGPLDAARARAVVAAVAALEANLPTDPAAGPVAG